MYYILLACLPVFVCISLSQEVTAQRYESTAGKVVFHSNAPLEDIEAYNPQVSSIFDCESGKIAFLIEIKKFQFEIPLMQKHFNESYMESHEHPNATFEGQLLDYSTNLLQPQQVYAEGILTVHGVSRKVRVLGTVVQDTSCVKIQAHFAIALADYDIKIPKVVFYRIADEVDVIISVQYRSQ